MRRTTSFIWTFIGLCLAFAALACNLSESAPPTLVPQASSTPPPTIGYATLSPGQLPQQATSVPQQQAGGMSALLEMVDIDRMMIHVDTLQRMVTRHVNSPYDQPGYGIGAARDYIRGQFDQISLDTQGALNVGWHTFEVNFGDVTSIGYNVYGVLQGTDVGRGVIVIGAHYDTITYDPLNASAAAPGANDNASGIAALIELARIMSTRQHRSTILFVAFSAEEIGRIGSQRFVEDYILGQNIQVTAMINLDIIGGGQSPDGAINDTQIRLFSVGPNNSPSRQLARAMTILDLIYVPNMEIWIENAEDRLNRYSDHLSFSEVGIPSVRFIEMLENQPRQHNTSDTMDGVRAIYLRRATQLILGTVTAMADGPRPPTNMTLRNQGGLPTLVWEPIPEATGYIVALRAPGSLIYNEYFETTETSVPWSGFVPSRYEGLAIASRDANGLLGPLSFELPLP